MAFVLKLDTSTGLLAQLTTADSIDVDIISQRTAGTDMTIGANLGTGDELQLGTVGELTRVMGDLTVDGAEIVSSTETVTGTFSANGDVNLGNDNGDTINLGGGLLDVVTLKADLVLGNGVIGAGDSFSGTAPAMTLTDAAGLFDSSMVGKSITIAGSTTPGNDGTFTILTVPGATSVTYSNASGAAEAFAGAWSVAGVGKVSIGSSVTDYLQALWLQAVNDNGPNLDAYRLNQSGANAGAYAIGINPSLLDNATATDLMTALDQLDAAISAATGTLQEAYNAGNTISVISADGTIDFSNDANSDTTTVLEVSRTPSSATAGIALQVTMGANASGTALEIDNGGTGAALDVQDGGTSVLKVTAAGKIEATPTSGENFKVVTAGAGVLEVDAAGGLDIDAAGTSHITVAAADLTLSTTTSGKIAVTSAGAIEIDAVGAVAIESSGAAISIGADAVAQAINIGTGAAARTITVGNASSTEVEVNAIRVDINAGSNGFQIDGAGASTIATSSGNLSLDSAAGELVFDDVGNSGLTLSQSGDRTLSQTGSGEVLEGATSVIGALNRLATVTATGPYQAAPIVDGVTIAAGDCVAQSTTTNRVTLWDGDESANLRFVGIAITGGTGNAGGTVLCKFALPGSLVTDSGASWTAGAALFGPEGTGRPVALASAPNDAGDAFKRLGWAHTSTSMYLDPGPTVILS